MKDKFRIINGTKQQIEDNLNKLNETHVISVLGFTTSCEDWLYVLVHATERI